MLQSFAAFQQLPKKALSVVPEVCRAQMETRKSCALDKNRN